MIFKNIFDLFKLQNSKLINIDIQIDFPLLLHSCYAIHQIKPAAVFAKIKLVRTYSDQTAEYRCVF